MSVLTDATEDLPGVARGLGEAPAKAAPVPFTVRAGYGLGAVGGGACAQVTAVLLLRFLTDNMGVPAALAGAVLGLLQIYEAILNPVVGIASDNTRSRWGRRIPYLLAGAVLLPTSVFLLFAMPKLPGLADTALLLLATLVLYGAAYTVWTVPFAAMGAEMTNDYHERSVIMSYRSYGGSAGLMLGSTLPAWLLVAWGATRTGHAKMGLTIALISIVSGLCAVFLLRRARFTVAAPGKRLSLLEQGRIVWNNRPFRTIAISHIVFLFGVATVAGSNAFFTRYVLRTTDVWLGTFYIVLMAGNLVSIPFWLWLSKRIDKKATYMWSMTAYGLLHLTWLLAHAGEPMPILVGRVFLLGMAMSGVILMGYSMLADAMRYDFLKSGMRLEGAFSGVNSVIERCSAAMGVAAMGLILGAVGYKASVHGAVHQGPAVIWGIYANFALIPAASALFSLVFMMNYKLREEDLRGT